MMKKITLLFFGILFLSLSVHAQSTDTKERIESQYVNAAHKAFIYQVSPQMKALDMLQLKKAKFNPADLFPEVNKLAALSTDTTWTFSEGKAPQDSTHSPSEYSYRWNEGADSENFTSNFNFFSWNKDSTSWFPKRSQKTVRSSTSLEDSTESLFYRNFDRNPYTGSRLRVVNMPTRNSNYETYSDRFTPENGWTRDSHDLRYRDENDRDTLQISERYDENDMVYKLSSEFRSIATPEFLLSSRKDYNSDTPPTIQSWDYEFTKLGEGMRFEYQVSKRWDAEKEMLVGRDSLQFIYKSDHVEGQVYAWDDSVWVIQGLYRSFQRTIPNPNPNDTFRPIVTLVDSVINYAILPDTVDANGNFIVGNPVLKTEFDYDQNGNQIEVRGFTLQNGVLAIRNRTVRTFGLIGDRYVLLHQDTYVQNFSTKELFKGGFFDQLYTAEGEYEGQNSYNLNAAGDTTGGRGNRIRRLDDGTLVNIQLKWDTVDKKLIVQNYRTNRSTILDVGRYINQSAFIDPITDSFSRQITVGGSYPGVFNDGPITISMGDTLSFYVSARNIDFTFPDVAVTNMPATATFDPATRKFMWVVDEENPSPMTYTATDGQGISSSIEVQFVGSENIAVSNEDEVFIEDEFVLSQNYPNPFNPTTNIQFSLPIASEVSLKVYNLLGQEVATLVNGRLSSGVQVVQFDASNLASGVYLYRLQTAGAVRTKKMLLIK